jgi:hypothetical protein
VAALCPNLHENSGFFSCRNDLKCSLWNQQSREFFVKNPAFQAIYRFKGTPLLALQLQKQVSRSSKPGKWPVRNIFCSQLAQFMHGQTPEVLLFLYAISCFC